MKYICRSKYIIINCSLAASFTLQNMRLSWNIDYSYTNRKNIIVI